MPETGNQNPHHTLFAGSLFSLATLTGWGLIWLMLRERHLGGTIILADAHIRYSKPISGKPHAVADLGALSGDLDRLARGRKARVQMQVEIFGDETPGAVFEGTYIVLPAKPFGPYEGRERRRVGAFYLTEKVFNLKTFSGPSPKLPSRLRATSRSADRAASLIPPN